MKFLSKSLHLWPVRWHSSWQECFSTRPCSSTCNFRYVLPHKHTQRYVCVYILVQTPTSINRFKLASRSRKYSSLLSMINFHQSWITRYVLFKVMCLVSSLLSMGSNVTMVHKFQNKLPSKLNHKITLSPCYGW